MTCAESQPELYFSLEAESSCGQVQLKSLLDSVGK